MKLKTDKWTNTGLNISQREDETFENIIYIPLLSFFFSKRLKLGTETKRGLGHRDTYGDLKRLVKGVSLKDTEKNVIIYN